MSHSNGNRHTLHLPGYDPNESPELFCERIRRRAEDFRNKKLISALHKVVYIGAPLEPDEPLPAPWNVLPEPLYFLSHFTQQPVVFNGFVWTCYADGTRHTMQHFVEGVDIYGGRPIHMWNGTVHLMAADGSDLVCNYRLGRCVSVTTRPAPPRGIV